MEKKTKVLGAGAMAAAAAVGVGVAVSRRSNAPPTLFHVRPAGDGWTVSKDGDKQAASTHGTKKEALSAGRKLASSKAPSTLVLHYADGREQKRVSYERD